MTLFDTAAQKPTASKDASVFAQTTKPAMTGTRDATTGPDVRCRSTSQDM